MGMELIPDLPGNVVGVRAIGEVDDDDYDDVLEPAIDAALQQSDKIHLLYVLGPEFSGFEADAMWEDTKLGFKTFTDYERLAVVTDSTWVRRAVKAFGWLIPGDVVVYSDDRLAEATAWITG